MSKLTCSQWLILLLANGWFSAVWAQDNFVSHLSLSHVTHDKDTYDDGLELRYSAEIIERIRATVAFERYDGEFYVDNTSYSSEVERFSSQVAWQQTFATNWQYWIGAGFANYDLTYYYPSSTYLVSEDVSFFGDCGCDGETDSGWIVQAGLSWTWNDRVIVQSHVLESNVDSWQSGRGFALGVRLFGIVWLDVEMLHYDVTDFRRMALRFTF